MALTIATQPGYSVTLFQAQSRRDARDFIQQSQKVAQELETLCDQAWALDPQVQATPAGTVDRQRAVQRFIQKTSPRLATLFPAYVTGMRRSLGLPAHSA